MTPPGTQPSLATWTALGALVTLSVLLAGCTSPSAKEASPLTSTSGPKTAVQAGSSTATTAGGSSSPASRLSNDACAPTADALRQLSPQAALNSSVLGDRGHQRVDDQAISFSGPFDLDANSTGTMVICRFATGQGNSSDDARLNVTVVDFTGGVNEDPGAELAKRALAKLRDRFGSLGADAGQVGAPEPVSGAGDDAFHAAWAGGLQHAVVARKGKLLVFVDAGEGSAANGGPQVSFGRLAPTAAELLDAAGAAVGVVPAPTTTLASAAANSIQTAGAISGIWVHAAGDAADCIAPVHVDVTLVTTDHSAFGHLEVGVSGDPKGVLFGSAKLPDSLVGAGGVDLSFSGDSAHPTATLKLDTTLTGNGGSPPTSVKGQLTFTCS